MSTRKGGGVHSRKPRHQNTFAFQHNPKSKKTAAILKMVNEGLCKACYDKVEWRKKYRKYKPLTQPATCRQCSQRTVTAAYHKICQACAKETGVCAWCCERRDLVRKTGFDTFEEAAKAIEAEAAASGMTLREKKALLRQAEKKFGRRKREGGGDGEGEGSEGGSSDGDSSDGGGSDDEEGAAAAEHSGGGAKLGTAGSSSGSESDGEPGELGEAGKGGERGESASVEERAGSGAGSSDAREQEEGADEAAEEQQGEADDGASEASGSEND